MLGKHVLLAVALCIFPATIDGGYLRNARTSQSQKLPPRDLAEDLRVAQNEFAKAMVGMRDAHFEWKRKFSRMKGFKALLKELTFQDNVEDAKRKLAKETAGVHDAHIAFEIQWRLMKDAEAWLKELSARDNTSSTEVSSTQDKGNAAQVNADDSGKAAVKEAWPKSAANKTQVNVTVKSNASVIAAEKDLDKAHEAVKSASAKVGNATRSASSSKAKPAALDPADTSAISRYIKGLTANSEKGPIVASPSGPAAPQQPRVFSIPYANDPPPRIATPLNPSGSPSASSSRILTSSCRGCSENLALAYQKCAAQHGNPCKELANGRIKDGSCCLLKNDHNTCLRCAQHGCPSASGCVAINKQYYSKRLMMPQLSIE